jgi:hypothetical protein
VTAKAVELLLIEMGLKAYHFTRVNTRVTIRNEDIRECVVKTDYFDFLLDLVDLDAKSLLNKYIEDIIIVNGEVCVEEKIEFPPLDGYSQVYIKGWKTQASIK